MLGCFRLLVFFLGSKVLGAYCFSGRVLGLLGLMGFRGLKVA